MSPYANMENVFGDLEDGAVYKEGFVVANGDALKHFHHVNRRGHVIKSTGLSNRNRRKQRDALSLRG